MAVCVVYLWLRKTLQRRPVLTPLVARLWAFAGGQADGMYEAASTPRPSPSVFVARGSLIQYLGLLERISRLVIFCVDFL